MNLLQQLGNKINSWNSNIQNGIKSAGNAWNNASNSAPIQAISNAVYHAPQPSNKPTVVWSKGININGAPAGGFYDPNTNLVNVVKTPDINANAIGLNHEMSHFRFNNYQKAFSPLSMENTNPKSLNLDMYEPLNPRTNFANDMKKYDPENYYGIIDHLNKNSDLYQGGGDLPQELYAYNSINGKKSHPKIARYY